MFNETCLRVKCGEEREVEGWRWAICDPGRESRESWDSSLACWKGRGEGMMLSY